MTTLNVTDEDRKLAAQVAAWMLSLSETEQTSDYMTNLATYGRIGVVNLKGVGIVASAVQAYNRDLDKKAEAAARPDFSKSAYQGKEGERLVIQVTLMSVFNGEGAYGPTYTHKFYDEAGNLYTWFGSSRLYQPGSDIHQLEDRLNPGMTFWIKGTVKRHSEYKGQKETHLSRVDAVLSPEEEAAQKAKAKAEKAAKAKAERAARKAL